MIPGAAPEASLHVATVGRGPVHELLADTLERDGILVGAAPAGPDDLPDAVPDEVDAVVLALGALGPPYAEALRVLREHRPRAHVIAVTPVPEPRAFRDLFHRGLEGLVLEPRVDRALAPVVRAVCAGCVSFPSELGGLLGSPVLSPREKQALGMVVLGFSNGEIARKLHLSESTVKSHLSSAFTKLGVRSRAAAASLILDPRTGFGAGILSITDDADRPPGRAPSASG